MTNSNMDVKHAHGEKPQLSRDESSSSMADEADLDPVVTPERVPPPDLHLSLPTTCCA